MSALWPTKPSVSQSGPKKVARRIYDFAFLSTTFDFAFLSTT